MPDLKSRFVGCLLGGAIGDALGAPLEFLTLAEIRARYGPHGLDHYVPAYGRAGALTDDTQMTLFTAEGLIEAYRRGRERGIWHPPSMVHVAYLRWLATQGERSAHPLYTPRPEGGLAALPELNERRGPGHTCLSALMTDRMGTVEEPLNDSKGCGGIMRIAPVGLAFREPFEPACQIAALTHGHPSGYLAAGVFAGIIARLVRGESLLEATAAASALLREQPRHEETLAALEGAVRAAGQTAQPSAEAVSALGEGWVAEEALAIGLYAALVARDFRHAIALSANHSGDSDSTAALTGQLLGALWGAPVLPEDLREGLELRAVIERMASDLYAVTQGA